MSECWYNSTTLLDYAKISICKYLGLFGDKFGALSSLSEAHTALRVPCDHLPTTSAIDMGNTTSHELYNQALNDFCYC